MSFTGRIYHLKHKRSALGKSVGDRNSLDSVTDSPIHKKCDRFIPIVQISVNKINMFLLFIAIIVITPIVYNFIEIFLSMFEE